MSFNYELQQQLQAEFNEICNLLRENSCEILPELKIQFTNRCTTTWGNYILRDKLININYAVFAVNEKCNPKANRSVIAHEICHYLADKQYPDDKFIKGGHTEHWYEISRNVGKIADVSINRYIDHSDVAKYKNYVKNNKLNKKINKYVVYYDLIDSNYRLIYRNCYYTDDLKKPYKPRRTKKILASCQFYKCKFEDLNYRKYKVFDVSYKKVVVD